MQFQVPEGLSILFLDKIKGTPFYSDERYFSNTSLFSAFQMSTGISIFFLHLHISLWPEMLISIRFLWPKAHNTHQGEKSIREGDRQNDTKTT